MPNNTHLDGIYIKQRLGRICHRCDKRYIPTGKHQKICEECFKESLRTRQINYCKYCGVRGFVYKV